MEQYWEWFCSIPGIYRTQQEILLRCFETPEAVYRASQEEFSYLRKRGCGWIERVNAYRREADPEKTVNSRKAKGIKFISNEHLKYPDKLRPLKDKPYGLFYKGSLPEDVPGSVAVVGARMCTRNGRDTAQQVAREIVRAGGYVISGAAYGIDGAAQWSALLGGGKSFAVLGCGVDRIYPASHRPLFERLVQQGGILSEFPPGTPVRRYHFPMRNRIISGLADAVVVIEAKKKSGSLITAEFAAEQGRLVLAVPGRMEDELSEGCNELISQGAEIILSVDYLVNRIFQDSFTDKRKLPEDIILAPAEKLVYSSLGLQAKNLWELEEGTALSLADLGDSLLSLELKGLIRETERNFYAKIR